MPDARIPPDSGQDRLADLIARARAHGADSADAVLFESTSLGLSVRHGRPEELERAESTDVGLRVFVGQRSAIVSATSLDPRAFDLLAERAVAMARVVPEDRFGGIGAADAPFDAAITAALELDDPQGEPDAASLQARAEAAEAAGLAVHGVTNSDGGSAGYRRSRISLVSSRGFSGSYARTSHSVSAVLLAGEGTSMQRDYDYHSAVHLADLDDPALIGVRAGGRAVARLNPVRPKTATLPVVYDPRVAGSLLGHLLGAINGAAIARGTSFLKDRMGTRILPEGFTLRDDPRRVRGVSSRPFDGEGTATAARALVEDGVLASWVLDGRSGRQLGLASTGNASRGTSGGPSPSTTNVSLSPGRVTPAELMADIGEGIYVSELMGNAVNGLTGDYSRGAAGFMIRDGALAEPIAEFTIAGNLIGMYASLAAADDLVLRRGMDSPTLRVHPLMVAGG